MELMVFLNDTILWGVPMLLLMLGTGLYLTVKTGGVVFTRFGTLMGHTGKTLFQKKQVNDDAGSITPFQAVSTALAATVGTGNIVGVAVAIQVGGPGAIFWMWVAALLGMVTKYAEVTLAMAYRERNDKGQWVGGPMFYIAKGMGKKRLASLFCIFGFLGSFGIGNMVQVNSMAGGVEATFGIAPWLTGLIVAAMATLVLVGGIRRISSVAEMLVPVMALFYIVGALVVLVINGSAVPAALGLIVKDAFTGTAAVGGFAGATVLYGMRIGVARGVFTNEAGLGSAPIAHATANNWHPARQGLWGAFEVFFDTLVMCTITALVILTSGLWTTDPKVMDGNAISQEAFNQAFRGGQYIITIGLILFAFATVIAWYYYGEKCVDYVAGRKGILVYRAFFIPAIVVGAVAELNVVWEMADMFNGFMALPNLIALLVLAPTVKALSDDFFRDPNRVRPKGTDYSRFLMRNGKMPSRKQKKK